MSEPPDRLNSVREDLDLLRRRFARGEIDEATYRRQRELILSDLSPAERAALGTSTPQPVNLSPRPGTPRPLGPSGGMRNGLRTSIPSLADLDLQPGTILLDQWKLERELGRGGFGAVFAAEELHLHEKQAVKVLDPAMVAKEELLARFRREVSLMRKLVHARIVRVFDYREDLAQLVALISMELVTGGSVKQLLALARERKLPIPLPLALEVLGQTLEALAEAHRQGVIHRDVTPGNVLLAGGSPEQLLSDPGRDPQVKLVDFGIAGLVERSELSQKSRVLGTAAYVAPEVLDPSVEVTPAADVYGAGAMAYELLTGDLPVGRFEGVRELRREVPEAVDGFVLQLLERRPEKRPSAQAGADGLRELRDEEERSRERLETERRAAAERAAREAEQRRRLEEETRHRQEQERREAEERSRQEAARRVAAEHDQARQQAEAEAARAVRAAERSVGPGPVGGDAPVAARRGVPAWVGLVAVIGVVVLGLFLYQQVGRRRGAEDPKTPASASGGVPSSAVAAGRAGIRWVRIPSGSFTMGCTSGDSECDGDESPAHSVTISRSFELAATETTVSQYQACVSAGRCAAAGGSQGGGEHPVVNVSWDESKAFCEWAGGRLPMEAEWEYAARGGRDGAKYPWGNSISHENANYGSDTCCSGLAQGRDRWEQTSPVGSFAANGYGLFDLSGNVWEWVSDWKGNYSGSRETDPTGPASGSYRVLRGGSWTYYPRGLRVSYRSNLAPDDRVGNVGFRCARTGNP